jgi:XTP/dITP diphosphohydrolase
VARIVLLVTSPRMPAGLLTAAAWDLVRAHPVLAAGSSPLTDAIEQAGASVSIVAAGTEQLVALAIQHDTVVWLAGPSGDEELTRELGLRLAQDPSRAELDVVYGSWDPPGARLLDVVTVMDALVSPGGDPWKRQQTHQTLARYLLEEAYEAYDAIEAHDLAALREELGDVLLQVVLHSRMAEDSAPGWSVDDVAGDLVDKLVRRNPHVFADATVSSVEEIVENWEAIKRREKARSSVTEGIALSQPALALAAALLSRARRAGIAIAAGPHVDASAGPADEAALGAALLALVAHAESRGLDAEAALRRAALAYAHTVREAEA